MIIPRLTAQSDTCDCKSDVEYIHQKIKKLSSYKKNKTAYQKAFQVAIFKATNQTSYYDCLEILNRLLIPLEDWHMGAFQQASDSLGMQKINYPVYDGDLDYLTQTLENKSIDEMEGIYHRKQDFSIGLVYDEANKNYQGVVLKSSKEDWKRGDVIYKFVPLPENFFKIIGGQYPTKRVVSYHERIEKGIILRSGFYKDTSATYYINSPYPEENYLFKSLSPQLDYLKMGSFSSFYPLLSDAETFYKSIDGKLTKPHLILDLRDNGGGGDRNSNIVLKQLKKYLKNNTIYLITNASTGSNAEQFTVKLKKYDNVITFGDKTKGALSYEIKSKDYHILPATNYVVILPSKAHKKYAAYETLGVAPDYFLNYEESWIAQIEDYIEKQKLN